MGVNVTEYCLGGNHQKPVDYHILRGSKMEDNVGHLSCPEGQSLSGKEKSLSDVLGTLSDSNVGLEKQIHKSDHEIDGCKSEKLAEGERIGHVSSTDCTKDNDYNLKQQSCVNNASSAVPLWISPAKSNIEVSAPFLEGNASTKKSSMSSDGCLDSIQPIETNQLEDRKIDGYPLKIGESELRAAVQTSLHDKQCKSESSSSNSTQLILQACSSDSCQEMSVDNKTCKNVKLSAIDTSTCTDFNIEEPAFRSLVLDTTNLLSGKQCNVIKHSEPIHNIRTRTSDKVPDLTSDDNCGTVENINQFKSDLPKKKGAEIYNPDRAETPYDLDDALDVAWRVAKEVEQEAEASGSSSSMEVRNSDMVHLSYADSTDSDKEGCLTEAGSIQQQCNEQDKSDSFSSAKEAVDLKMLTKKEQFCLEEAKEPLHDMVPGINDGCQKLEPSMRPEGSGDQTCHVFGIDLNEDVLENEVEHTEKSVKEAASICENVSKPIPMAAKSGICLPVPQFQSAGELSGWRGSSATSAFRRTSFSESCSRNKALSTNDTIGSSNYSHVKGIDLNVAAGVDFDVELLPKKSIPALSSNYTKESSVEVSSRQARMFDIDLNCVSENDENCRQLSPPASLSSHSVRDFDLNDNPISADACIDPYWPCEGTRANGGFDDPAISSVENSRQSDCKSFRSSCSPHLSSMEGFSHSHHAKPFLVAATNMLPSNEQMQRIVTLEHKASFTQSYPHAFLYNNGFYFDPNNSISSTVYPPPALPYMTDPHATTVIPQILGSGTLPMFSGAPHLMEVPHGSSPSDFAFIRPTFDLNAGANCPENGSRGTSARQLCIPLSNSTVEEQMKSFQQVALTATPMKRREPDGGWDSHQLCLRQAASWR